MLRTNFSCGVLCLFSLVIVLELQSFRVANQTPGASDLGFSLWPRGGGRGGEKHCHRTGGKLKLEKVFYGGGLVWKMGNDKKILVVKDSTSNWRWKWWRFGRLVAGRMEILMDGAFLLHHQAWSKLGSESVSWCHGMTEGHHDSRSRKSVDVSLSRLPGPWQASKPRCSMPTRLGKADLDGLGIIALSWQRTRGFVTCQVRVLKLS